MAKKVPPPPTTGSLFEPDDDPSTAGALGSAADDTKYEIDPSDILPAEVVEPHSREKHLLVREYVDICRGVRKQWKSSGDSATFVDLFSGPGRVVYSDDKNAFHDGSCLLAWKESCRVKGALDSQFTGVFVGDADRSLLDAASIRLRAAGAPISSFHGEAEDTVGSVVASLPKKGFHFALLDPYRLKQLPFSIITTLAKVGSLDMLILFSASGLLRNLGHNLRGDHSTFDRFAPGWRGCVDQTMSDEQKAREIKNHWFRMVNDLGKPARGEIAVTRKGVPMYWLVLLSRHDLAEKFFIAITKRQNYRPLLDD